MSLTAQPIDTTMRALGARVVVLFTGLTVIALLAISNMMLARFGLEYETPGGSPLEKIHPATYLGVLALGALTLSRLNPIALIDDIVTHHKGLVALAIAFVALLMHVTLVQRMPFTQVFDTFFLPMALLVLLTRISEASARSLAFLVHFVMFLNAVIGLVEFGTGQRLTPLVANGILLTADWRSSALLGHPLANATATGCYILMLMLGGGRDLPGPLRVVVYAIQIPAMAVFGGRAAMVLLGILGAVVVARQMIGVIGGRRITLAGAATIGVILPTAIFAVGFMFATGFFDRFLDRFVEDDGSAATRVNMFVMLAQIPTRELLIAPDPEQVATLQRLEGLEFGIESFWVAFIAYYGVLISIPFFAALLAYFFDLWRATRPQSWWVLFYFVAVTSTSASLSGKTTAFGVFVAMYLLLMRETDEVSASGERR